MWAGAAVGQWEWGQEVILATERGQNGRNWCLSRCARAPVTECGQNQQELVLFMGGVGRSWCSSRCVWASAAVSNRECGQEVMLTTECGQNGQDMR